MPVGTGVRGWGPERVAVGGNPWRRPWGPGRVGGYELGLGVSQTCRGAGLSRVRPRERGGCVGTAGIHWALTRLTVGENGEHARGAAGPVSPMRPTETAPALARHPVAFPSIGSKPPHRTHPGDETTPSGCAAMKPARRPTLRTMAAREPDTQS